jgi:hypothetical protein
VTEVVDPLAGVEYDHAVRCRADYPALSIVREDWLLVAEREPVKGETTVVLIDGMAKLGMHPVEGASRALGVVVFVLRRLVA